jgi:hypothetical protein
MRNFQTQTTVNARTQKLPVSWLQQWVVYPALRDEQNNICVANDSGPSARKYNENFSTETEYQGSLYLVLKSGTTEYFFFTSSDGSVYLFWNLHAMVSFK